MDFSEEAGRLACVAVSVECGQKRSYMSQISEINYASLIYWNNWIFIEYINVEVKEKAF